MPQYSAFIALDSGHYAEVDHLIEAPDPVPAAQRLLDSETIDLRDHFPIFLIVEERSLSVFTHDRLELRFWEGDGPSDQHPSFFVRIHADRLAVGAGMLLFTPYLLARYRQLVDQPETGRDLAVLLRRLEAAGMRIEGESLRRPPRPFTDDHERLSLLK